MSGFTPLDRLFYQNTMRNMRNTLGDSPFGLSSSRADVMSPTSPVNNLQYINEQRSDPVPLEPIGGFSTFVDVGNLQAGQMGPLNRLGQFINQELDEQNQGEVDEFIGEVGEMANQRF